MLSQPGGKAFKALVFASLTVVISISAGVSAHEYRDTAFDSGSDSYSEGSNATKQSNAGQQKTLRALRITAENAAELVQKGPDAIGGINDWFISNGTLCAIVSDVDHEHEFSTKGGVLVDLGFCGRADDHYTLAQDLVDGKRERPLDAVSIEASIENDEARITVQSATHGAAQLTTYSLNLNSPSQLAISKKLYRLGDDDSDFSVYSSLNFNYHSLEPFVFASRNFSQTNGFRNQDFVSRGLSALSVAARNADTIITISPPTATDPIAYGWHLKSVHRVTKDHAYEVPSFILADNQSNAILTLTDTFYIGDGSKIGWLQLPQIPLLSLNEQSWLEIEEVIYVGNRGDVSSITDQIFTNAVSVSGYVSDPQVGLHIDQSDGTPLTHARPDENGRFEFFLPQGTYQLRQIGSAKRRAIERFQVGENAVRLSPQPLSKAAQLLLPAGEAMRLVFVGVNGTPDPDFTDTHTASSVIDDEGEHFREAVSQIFLAGLPSDVSKVTLAPGDYRVYATRGPEYSLEKADISLEANHQVKLTIAIPELRMPTPNFIASDLHVHSGSSFDNTFSDAERVRTFVAEHGEVMVSSEHDLPFNLLPIIKAMGVERKITSIAAAEVTSLMPTASNPYTGGHSNFFPYEPEPHAHRRGMVSHEQKRLREIIHAVKQKHPDVIVQLNHPRLNLALSDEVPDDYQNLINNAEYLEHMGAAGYPYNPNRPLTSSPNNSLVERDAASGLRDIDFDLIEIINPGGIHHQARIRAVRKDWISFLKQGERIVGTANSDSHTSAAQVGLPRTMVAMKDDRVSEFAQSDFIAALKAGNAYGTTGPFMEIALSGKKMGETLQGASGQLSMRISSVDWIDIDTVKVQVNGSTIKKYKLTKQAVHNLQLPIAFAQDSFVTIEVSGPAGEDYQAVYSGLTPYAFSNPIYVDFDADGEWQAPGL